MGIRQFKPVTKSSRFRSVSDFDTITRSTPEKSLVEPKPKSGGRDNHGHIAMRRIGGGHKQMYRVIDFKRNKFGVVGTVKEIEYDPNRSARIALIEYTDGEKRYIIHPKGLKQGDTVVSGPGADVRNGNALPLKEIPLGTAVHCVEITPKKGAQMARSAGTSVQVVAKEGDYVTLAFVREYDDPAGAGKKYTTTWFDMLRIVDGKVVEHWDSAMKGASGPVAAAAKPAAPAKAGPKGKQ